MDLVYYCEVLEIKIMYGVYGNISKISPVSLGYDLPEKIAN